MGTFGVESPVPALNETLADRDLGGGIRRAPQGALALVLHRAADKVTILVRGGEFYPRWAPNFFHGYGYPIFNYYAPLTYYLALPVTLMPWFDAVDGVKFVFVMGL